MALYRLKTWFLHVKFSSVVILARPASPDNEDSFKHLAKKAIRDKIIYTVETKSPIDALSFAVLR
jgi:hypothetical protein